MPRSPTRLTVKYIHAGDRFERLTVLGPYERRGKNNDAFFQCRCDCGTETWVRLRMLGNTKSCGCAQKESQAHTFTTHGDSRKRLYRIWVGIYARCHDPNDTGYRWYGERGISVCPEWAEYYEPFRDWAHANGYTEDLVLDRIDTGGNYEPGNCRWVTVQENNRNKWDNRWIEAWGECKVLAAWTEDPRCKVNQKTLWHRLSVNGWSPEEAISTPSLGTGKHRADFLPGGRH